MNETQQLVAQVIGGDMHAFETLYNMTYRQVYYTCMSFLKNEQNVLDVMQDTYLNALTHLSSLREPERFCAWLNQIAVNRCKTFLAGRQILPLDEEQAGQLLEPNEDFLPENYVTNVEKRKIVLSIMEEELSAIQYQTIVLYYFDGMSVAEIAACMECPEGTVTYRLSAARARIKAGVEQYETLAGVKLRAHGAVPLLTAIFVAETQGLSVPNMLAQIFGAASAIGGGAAAGGIAAGAGTAAAAGKASAGSVAAAAGVKSAGAAAAGKATAGSVAAAAGVKSAGARHGFAALFQTVKAKIIAATVAVAVAGGATAAVVIHNQAGDTSDAPYTEVHEVICDNEYLNITIDRIYDKGVSPEEIASRQGDGEGENDCQMRCQLTNKTDESIALDMTVLTVNNQSMSDDFSWSSTCELTPNQECPYFFNLHESTYLDGSDPLTWAEIEVAISVDDGTGMLSLPVYYDIVTIYPYGEDKAVNYEREKADDREQVIVEDDRIRITYLGTNFVDYACRVRPIFYIENLSDEDINICATDESYVDMVIMAHTGGYYYNAYFDYLDEDYAPDEAAYQDAKERYLAGETREIKFHTYDYSAFDGYVGGWKYRIDTGADDWWEYGQILGQTAKDYSTAYTMYEYIREETQEQQ